VSVAAPALGRRSGDPSDRVYRIERSRRDWLLVLSELWAYRELLFFFVWRDVKVRYRQALLGALWVILQPFLTMIVFSVIFGHLAGISDPYKDPYPLFVFAGLLPWTYFSSCLAQSSTSVVGNSNLVTKVYFPRLIMPLASTVVPIIDFLVAFLLLIGLFFYYGRTPHWHAVATPVFLGMALMTALGVGLWLSALNVRYKDVPYTVPFLTQLWLFASPVIYPVTLVPARWHWLLALNPMTGVIDGFRWAVLGRGVPHYSVFATSAAVGFALVVGGLWYFKRVERRFADVI
jgi:lipopolysaccharide transport system permease protein